MSLPSLASYPPAQVRKDLGSNEWEACLDAWLSLSELYLRLGQQEFSSAAPKNSSLVAFLKSYYHEISNGQQHHGSSQKTKESTLKRTCFILTHRVLLGSSDPPPALLQWDFLSDFSQAYMKIHSLELLTQSLWKKKGA